VIVNIPAPPANLAAQVTTWERVALNGTDAAVNETGYAVQRRNSTSGKWSTVAVLPAGVPGEGKRIAAGQSVFFTHWSISELQSLAS